MAHAKCPGDCSSPSSFVVRVGHGKKYFVTGEESLRVDAAEAFGAEFDEVRTLARREIQALCLACEHSTLPSCELRRALQ